MRIELLCFIKLTHKIDISWEGSRQHWEKQPLIFALAEAEARLCGHLFCSPLATHFLYPRFSFFALIS